ncbi:MAG: hypothetical protein LBT80_01625 [Lactobacillaceae bacterium]|jgi:hypothetical protein|nr:hypothetical protein [Lactobacillaceae bacterium]
MDTLHPLLSREEVFELLNIGDTFFNENIRFDSDFVKLGVERLPNKYSTELLLRWINREYVGGAR